MKKLILMAVLGSVALFGAETHVSGLETDTNFIVLEGKDSRDFNKKVFNLINDSNAETLMKKRFEEAARIEDAQRAMKEKYKVNLDYKKASDDEIEASRALQAERVRLSSKYFLETSYKDLTVEKCSKFKDSETYSKAICKAKNENKIDEALEDLDSILKTDDKAFCLRAMISLAKADKDNEIISDATKDAILVKMKGFKKTNTCNRVLEISTKEVSRG